MTQQPSATAVPSTLRERARLLAEREILHTALRLFTEQGYDETSIAQIAEEAGVSRRTLFRYFGAKEDLVGGSARQLGRVLEDQIRRQPAADDAWKVLRAGIAAVQASHDSRDQALERFRILHSTASLRAAWLEKRLRFQEDLLPLITERMDIADSSTDHQARAVIGTVFVCLDAASMTWVENDGQGNIMDLYDECIAAVRGAPSVDQT
jgi:AcrR family transcriptional regulator